MASTGLPFLLLVSSALLISTAISPASADPNQQKKTSPEELTKVQEDLKKLEKFIVKNIDTITSVACPFLEMIPVCGPFISAIIKGVTSQINKNMDMATLMDEFENLNTKLDQYHVEQKWNSWASGVYQQAETDIDVAWTMFTTLRKSLRKAKDDKERERHMEIFKEAYKNFEPATKKLHVMLIKKGVSFRYPLGDLLAEHVNCHENIIREYTVFINKLIYKGITMNEFYYKLMDTSDAMVNEQATIAYNAASVMFQVHMQCINTSMDYFKKDVEAQIDKTKTRSELAKNIWSFLVNVYDRYDWMVVAFITKKSHHEKIKFLNRHNLLGFTEVKKGGVSVAVARQVKGTHTKADLVKQAIQKCIDKPVLCYKVTEKLSECSVKVENKPISEMFTAVHAYLREAHDGQDVQDEGYDISAAPEDSSAQTSYIYRGKCQKSKGVKGGKFVVLIKGDEEIMTEDPCSKLDCGEKTKRGSCVPMTDMFLAMCQCNMPYYGQNCEKSLDDYKRYLQGNILMIESRHRLVGSRQ